MDRVSVNGVELEVIETGDGPDTILFLHGALGEASLWTRHATRLAPRFHCIALSDRGHGRSTPFGTPENPWEALSIANFVEDARAALTKLAPRGAHLVGHSRGGTVASWIAALDPDRVRSLVVAASPPEASVAFRAYFRDATPPPGELATHVYRYLAEIPDDAWPRDELRVNYHGPALILEGADDPLYSPVHTMLWRATLRRADIARVPGAHRFPFDGREGETHFARLLDGFLDTHREGAT